MIYVWTWNIQSPCKKANNIEKRYAQTDLMREGGTCTICKKINTFSALSILLMTANLWIAPN